MSSKKRLINSKKAKIDAKILREKAERIASGTTFFSVEDLSPDKIQELLQELHVHQIELEMQNDELHQSKDELNTVKERYFDLYELAPVGYFTLTAEGKILQANLTATILLSTPKSALINHLFNNFIAPEDQDIAYLHFKSLLSTYASQSFELQMIKGDGSKFWAQVDVSHSQNTISQRTLRLVINDISERKNTQRDLAIAAIAFESQNGIVITNAKGTILRVNQAFTRITGYAAKEAIGQYISILKSGRQGEQFYARLWSTLSTQGRWQGEIWNRRKNGEVYAELLTITEVNKDGLGVTHYVGNFSDITEDKEAEAAIHRLAYHDSLTGLPNRRLLQDRITQSIYTSVRSLSYGAILFIDVDYFKTLNDTRGHNIGDLLLVDLAQRLRANVRQSDTVGRQGGDEFVILLDELSHEMSEAATMAQQLGEKLHEVMKKPFDLNGFEYHCKISIGISLVTKDATVEDLLKHADIALYKAKDEGRNRLRFFDPTMQEALEYRNTLESELNYALSQKQFYLYYQPQVDAQGQVQGAEALIRWHHPIRGVIPPHHFISLAEDTELILFIGSWVMESACSQLKKWEESPLTKTLQIAVNVSAREFRQINYVSQVKRIIQTSGINPSRLKLELTESIVLDNISDTIEKMNMLKQLGVTFSIDDFGTGFSSLSYLAKLPLDQLKIDKSFVDNIPGAKNDELIIKIIINMANGLEMDVIAEGVETQAQRDFLEANGCITYQGYLFSKPLPITEFEHYLKLNSN